MASGTQWGRSTRSNSLKEPNIEGEISIDQKVGNESNDKIEGDDEVHILGDGNEQESIDEEDQDEGLKESVTRLQNTIDRLTLTLSSVDTRFQNQDAKIKYLESKCDLLSEQNKQLNERVILLENERRILNIKIDGVKEKANENMIERVLKLAEAMGSDCQASDIDSAYRLGKKLDKQVRPRTIMLRFKTKEARHEFYNARFKLKEKKEWSRVWVNDDVNEHTRRRREAMRSIATLCRDSQVDCKIRSDSIIIKGQKFWINELEQIPSPYSLEDAKIRNYNNELYFQSEYAWPSNMAPARVTIGKQTYMTSEHAWNGVKAIENDDIVAAERIKKTTCPYEAKRIGDRIRTTRAWEKCQFDVMFEIVYQKTVENPEIKEKLVATGTKKLHEATRSDTFGIGAGLFSKQVREGRWSGKDILGQIWEKVRDDLISAL